MEKTEILEILKFESNRYATMAKLADGQMRKEYVRRATAFNEAKILIESLEKIAAVQSFEINYPTSPKEKRKWTSQYGTNAYYAGKHWAVRKKDSEFWHWLVKAATANIKPVKSPVELCFLWDDGIDVDNHSIMGKMITDALKGKVIPDDNRRYLKAVRHGFNEDNVIRVQIREIRKPSASKNGRIAPKKTTASEPPATKKKQAIKSGKNKKSQEAASDHSRCKQGKG